MIWVADEAQPYVSAVSIGRVVDLAPAEGLPGSCTFPRAVSSPRFVNDFGR
jgi:hypothetical protein